MDDHSSITFLDPKAAESLNLPQELFTNGALATSTIQRDSKVAPNRTIAELVVIPLHNKEEVDLPLTII